MARADGLGRPDLIVAAFFLTALKAALPPVDGYIDMPRGLFATASGPATAGAFVARLLAQKDLPNVRVEKLGAFTVAGSLAIGLTGSFEGLRTKAYRGTLSACRPSALARRPDDEMTWPKNARTFSVPSPVLRQGFHTS